MKVEGSCHCGLIRYEAEIDPPFFNLRVGTVREG